MLGFLTATVLLHAMGLGLGWVARHYMGEFGWRSLGGFIVAGVAFVVATQ